MNMKVINQNLHRIINLSDFMKLEIYQSAHTISLKGMFQGKSKYSTAILEAIADHTKYYF